MTTIVVGGDCATTSALAVAAGWPVARSGGQDAEVMLVEADPGGGSIAAWLDVPLSPSLSSVVTALRQVSSSGTRSPESAARSTVDAMTRRSSAGLRFIPAPFRTREARGALAEADGSLFPMLASADGLIALLDVGRLDPLRVPSVARSAELVVVVHRQDASSAPAATVRLERLAETVTALANGDPPVSLVVVGDTPFDLDEIVDFAGPIDAAWMLPVDPLSAAVLAGRTGVSARRLGRLPLMRATARLAADLYDRVARADRAVREEAR